MTTLGAQRIRQPDSFFAGNLFAQVRRHEPIGIGAHRARRPRQGISIMQRVTLVRYTAKPDRAGENEALSRAAFAELRAKTPGHIGYALFRDGADFLHLFVNLRDEDAGLLTDLDSFKAFGKDSQDRCVAPPEVSRFNMQLVDSYGFEAAMAAA
jgi:quinol monooxygenase YgiN